MIIAAWKRTVTIVILCLCWFGVASMSNIIGKTVLNNFPYPMTLTFSQLFSSTVYSVPLLYFGKLRSDSIPKSNFKRWVLPLAVGKCLASVSSHIAIWKVPVSYAHTVKATLPLFTVALTRVLFGEKQKVQVHLSLIPIIAGVAIATVTELAFDVVGLMAALTATAGFSLQNIFSKKLMKETGAHSFVVASVLARVSMLIFLPLWLGFDVRRVLAHQSSVEDLDVDWWNLIMLLVLDGMLNFSQNLLAFAFLSMVTPLTYAVASTSKRLAIIGISLLLFRNDVTVANVAGILLAVGGVLLYTRAKHNSKSNISVVDDTTSAGTASYSGSAVTIKDPLASFCSTAAFDGGRINNSRVAPQVDPKSKQRSVPKYTSAVYDSLLVTPQGRPTCTVQRPSLSHTLDRSSEKTNIPLRTAPLKIPEEPEIVIPTFTLLPINPVPGSLHVSSTGRN